MGCASSNGVPMLRRPRMIFARALSASVVLAAVAVGQTTTVAATPWPVGMRNVAWQNPGLIGSPQLEATVAYPAIAAGVDTPVQPNPQGWPVIVFLHGFGWIGADYGVLADRLASQGFVVIAADTCQWSWTCQEEDGRAIHSALVTETGDSQSPFFEAFDRHRVALVGHSMGGSSAGNILVANPGYRCAFTFAPALPLVDPTPIDVPFGIVVGTADAITPPGGYAQPYYNTIVNAAPLRFLYLLDYRCDHMNVAGLIPQPWSTDSIAVFDRATSLAVGFLRHAMGIDPTGLEAALGTAPLAEPMLVSMQHAESEPQVWANDQFRIGATNRVSIAAQSVLALLMAANALGPRIPTPFGDFLIDYASTFTVGLTLVGPQGRADFILSMPPDPTMVGLPIALQAIVDDGPDLRLGNAWLMFVEQ